MGKLRNHKTRTSQSCIFCGGDENDEAIFGTLFHRHTVSVHQNCMFFASGLVQRGRKNRDGILRFLMADLKQEAARGNKLKCSYCKLYGATIGCNVNSCRRSFHFPCGVENHVVNQHFGRFESFCHVHKPKQKSIKVKNEPYCYICCTSVAKSELEDCVYAPCCKNNWFHRLCIQRYAISAGQYFFKCPLCNNTSDFLKEMMELGIRVPDKDAAWELENNAYQDLLYRPPCGASTCKCQDGRKHEGQGMWVLLPCFVCGADARHIKCENLSKYASSWKCANCESIEAAIEKSQPSISVAQEENDEQDENSIPDTSNIVENTLEISCSYLAVKENECENLILDTTDHSEDKPVPLWSNLAVEKCVDISLNTNKECSISAGDVVIPNCIKSENLLSDSVTKTYEHITVAENTSVYSTKFDINNCLQELNIIKVESLNNAVPFVSRISQKRKAVNRCKGPKSKRHKVNVVKCCDNRTNHCIREMLGGVCIYKVC